MGSTVSRAFAESLIAQLPALRRYALGLCGQPALADDLVQDGIERALGAAGALRDGQRIGSWLRSIVHNLYLDELRRRRVRGTGVDLDDVANDPALSTPARDATAIGEFQRALARLQVEHRQILVLAGVEEMSYREIAEELGLAMGTVMSRLSRARAALREAMDSPARPAMAGERPQ